MKRISGIILGALLYFSFASSASAAVLSPFFACPSMAYTEGSISAAIQQQYNDCLKSQQEAQKQAKDKTCQTNLDNLGGHGISVYKGGSGSESCAITCNTGYYLTVSNTCAPTLATMNQAITSQTFTSTQLIQQTKQSSGLTDSQIQAIVMLLQAFGADQSVVVQVEAALRGGL